MLELGSLGGHVASSRLVALQLLAGEGIETDTPNRRERLWWRLRLRCQKY